MTSQITKDFYNINGRIIPDAYRPQFCSGVEPPLWEGETNLFDARVGYGVGGTCTLIWKTISEDVLSWWFHEFWGATIGSIPATTLILPDPYRLGDPFSGSERYIAHHGAFMWGMVHRIERTGGERFYLKDRSTRTSYYVDTQAIVSITKIGSSKLGSVPPL